MWNNLNLNSRRGLKIVDLHCFHLAKVVQLEHRCISSFSNYTISRRHFSFPLWVQVFWNGAFPIQIVFVHLLNKSVTGGRYPLGSRWGQQWTIHLFELKGDHEVQSGTGNCHFPRTTSHFELFQQVMDIQLSLVLKFPLSGHQLGRLRELLSCSRLFYVI